MKMTLKKMFNLIHEVRNANWNSSEMLFFTYQRGKDKSSVKLRLGEHMGNKPIIYCLVSINWLNLYEREFGKFYQNHKSTKLLTQISFLGILFCRDIHVWKTLFKKIFTAALFIIYSLNGHQKGWLNQL